MEANFFSSSSAMANQSTPRASEPAAVASSRPNPPDIIQRHTRPTSATINMAERATTTTRTRGLLAAPKMVPQYKPACFPLPSPRGGTKVIGRWRTLKMAAARGSKGTRGGVCFHSDRARASRRSVLLGVAACSSPPFGMAAASNPWDPAQPTAARLMLTRCLSAGVLAQDGHTTLAGPHKEETKHQRPGEEETLDNCGKPAPSFARLSEAEQIAERQAKINQIKLDTEVLQKEKEAADITHPFYLTQKCQKLQVMNRHLQAVLKEKKALRQRLVKPICQESLPIEAVFHRSAVELFAMGMAFIENLQTHLATVHSIPQIPLTMKNMDISMTKMDLLVTETEELAEDLLEWREKQKLASFDSSQQTAGSDSWFKSITLE